MAITVYQNQYNDVLEIHSDLILNLNYWDCECINDFIHNNSEKSCVKCHATKEFQPNSRETEVIKLRSVTSKGRG